LRSALSVRAGEGKLLIVDGLAFDKPKTKLALSALGAWKAEGKVLLVLTNEDVNVAFAFRNLQHVHVVPEHQLNTYDVLNADCVVFVRAALEAFQKRSAPKTDPAEGKASTS
jgi:large subunit ribosomal protein L4